ncbi:hypothetical protein BOX15_Mlig030451g2 [Macrostomum lignano]|uniref:Uncharacterized protein n=2 Tax=Macrostomum lignano TaxID=282301 RepID=A0A267GDS2_9PLAT|nr:hypothetical protein BOX15_Mlig030451g1 [Macrostomum lignano]PAA84173.1 hypothetical protein BOX15_Mlig030451g2 [Macrostomum lignano]
MESNKVQPAPAYPNGQQQSTAMAMQPVDQQHQHHHHHHHHGGRHEAPWMEKPGASSNSRSCPPGLEYLSTLDQVLIKQKKEFFEMVSGFEMQNKYVVYNSMGQKVYFAKESSDTCVRQCCGPQRPFELAIEDSLGNEVIHVSRPYKCMCYHQMCSCCKCCFDEVTVESPPGNKVGKVVQVYGACQAMYHIKDESDCTVLVIDGPTYLKCYCPGDDIPFRLMSKDSGEEIGRVSKQWTNLLQEYFTDADNFGITFPVDLSVKIKAVILAACFLIDFMFFERQGGRSHH